MCIGEYPPQAVPVTNSVPAAAARLPLTKVAELVELSEELPAEMAMLVELGVGKPDLERAAQNAIANRTSIKHELIANVWVEESAYYGAIARAMRLPCLALPCLALPCLAWIEDGTVVDDFKLDSRPLNPTALRLTHSPRAPLTAIAPRTRQIDEIGKSIARYPDLKRSLVIPAPCLIRTAVWRAALGLRSAPFFWHRTLNSPSSKVAKTKTQ
jgi:hypothetical protein